MKKMIKLSLVAAVAVAGLTTSATAGSLADAIKDTTISGKAMIGYNYADTSVAMYTKGSMAQNTSTAKGNANNDSANQTEYDFDITMNTKVNDTITFTSGIQADHTVANRDETTNENGSQAITLTKLYFTAKTDVATVMVGKQKQPTVFLDDERGDGIVALIPAGPVTVAAGHITGLLSDRSITAAAVIGKVGPVNASLWALDVTSGTADAVAATFSSAAVAATPVPGVSGYSLNLNGTFGPVNVDLTHSSLELDDTVGSEDESLTKLIVSGKVADVNLVAGYGMTNDTASVLYRGHGVDLSSDGDAKTNFRLDQIVLDDYDDAAALLLGASMTFGQTTVGANYLMATVDQNGATDIDATELDLTVAYAMSKNFSITGLYSDAELENGAKLYDETRMELSLNYKF